MPKPPGNRPRPALKGRPALPADIILSQPAPPRRAGGRNAHPARR